MLRISDPVIASLLKRGEEVCFTVVSGSMRPLFSPGDKIGVRRKGRPYGFGDVVLFSDKAGFCVHRVIGTMEGRFLTKGDGKRTSDRLLRRESILGHAVWVERGGTRPRRISRFPLDGMVGRCLNMALGAVSLTEFFLWRICACWRM